MLDGDYLWIGTYAGGIRVINLRTGAVKAYTHSRGIPIRFVATMCCVFIKDEKEKFM